MLKVRPHTKSGGAVHFRSEIRKVGGGAGGNSLQVRYEKWGGGGQFASGPIRKVGGGQFASGPIRKVGGGPIPLLITINGYNFDQGGAQALHTRARE